MGFSLIISKFGQTERVMPVQYRLDGKNADCAFIINSHEMQTEMCDYLFDRYEAELRNQDDQLILVSNLNSYSNIIEFIHKVEWYITQCFKKYGSSPFGY